MLELIYPLRAVKAPVAYGHGPRPRESWVVFLLDSGSFLRCVCVLFFVSSGDSTFDQHGYGGQNSSTKQKRRFESLVAFTILGFQLWVPISDPQPCLFKMSLNSSPQRAEFRAGYPARQKWAIDYPSKNPACVTPSASEWVVLLFFRIIAFYFQDTVGFHVDGAIHPIDQYFRPNKLPFKTKKQLHT